MMKVGVFGTKPYDEQFLTQANQAHQHDLVFFEPRITPETVALTHGFDAICAFVNDQLHRSIIEKLAQNGVKLIALRCAGFNNVDLQAAQEHNITVARVPAYSPYAVAEHAVALLLSLNRRVYRAYSRVREGNFALDGLLGFDVHGSTVGVVGTGKIGIEFCRIMQGFGCTLLAYDVQQNPDCLEMGVQYVSLDDLFAQSDIISLHCPLNEQTYHLIDQTALSQMKDGVALINTSRGALVDTQAVIDGLKSGKIGYLGLDVYEEEEALFFEDLSTNIIQDDVFARLLTFPNVIITGHQGFFTENALQNIAETTLTNITEFAKTGQAKYVVKA